MKILQMAFKALPQQQGTKVQAQQQGTKVQAQQQGTKVQAQQRVTNPILSAPKMNLQGPEKDMFVKSAQKPQETKKKEEYTNEDAMALMREELKDAMQEEELNTFMENLDGMCKYLNIEPKDLPINEEHPGNLTEDQRKQVFYLLKVDSLSPVTK